MRTEINIEHRTPNIEHRSEVDWMLLGRQVRTIFGRVIDLLAKEQATWNEHEVAVSAANLDSSERRIREPLRKAIFLQNEDFSYCRAEQSRAEQSRAEQSRAEQSRAEQSRAEQSRAEQSRAEYRRKTSLAAVGENLGILKIRNGREYKQATITRVTDVGLEIRHEDGIARIQAPDLDFKLQDRFQWKDDERRQALEEEIKDMGRGSPQ